MGLWNQQIAANWKPVFRDHALTEACLHHKGWAGEAPSETQK